HTVPVCLPLIYAYHSLHVIELQDLTTVRKLHWTCSWHQIIFTDESRYYLLPNDGGRRKVMICGVISYGSRFFLVFVEQILNTNWYVGNVLDPLLILYVNGLQIMLVPI
ncbi:hypothetical protein BDFB_009953, partial [Asbolus verrucosus]